MQVVDLPNNKRGEIGLTYIFGIGRSTARKILAQAGVNYDKKVSDWNDDELSSIRSIIGEIKVEGALRSEVQTNIKRLMGYRFIPWNSSPFRSPVTRTKY